MFTRCDIATLTTLVAISQLSPLNSKTNTKDMKCKQFFFGTITGMVDSRLHASKQPSFYGVFSGNRSIREKYLISSVDFSALYWLLRESWCLGGDSCICNCNVITTLGFTAVLCNSHRSMASKILLRLQFFDLWLFFLLFFFCGNNLLFFICYVPHR